MPACATLLRDPPTKSTTEGVGDIPVQPSGGELRGSAPGRLQSLLRRHAASQAHAGHRARAGAARVVVTGGVRQVPCSVAGKILAGRHAPPRIGVGALGFMPRAVLCGPPVRPNPSRRRVCRAHIFEHRPTIVRSPAADAACSQTSFLESPEFPTVPGGRARPPCGDVLERAASAVSSDRRNPLPIRGTARGRAVCDPARRNRRLYCGKLETCLPEARPHDLGLR
jgi:hypothetical protein